MDKQQRIERAALTAKTAQIEHDICARSVMIGLQTILDDMPDEMVTASLSLAGGTGAASGSCGAYCAGLLGVGLKFNYPVEDELESPELKLVGVNKFTEYRDRFLREFGTVMCPAIHEKLFGRSYIFTDPKQNEEFLMMPGHAEKCAEVVEAAARIAAEMILAEEA